MQKHTIEKMGKIILTLKETRDWLHIREISRKTNIHPQTVSNIIDKYLSPAIEVRNLNDYGLKVKLVKIKDLDANLEGILKYLKITGKVK
jgi:DNA-binding IclR family transcriptional regulator